MKQETEERREINLKKTRKRVKRKKKSEFVWLSSLANVTYIYTYIYNIYIYMYIYISYYAVSYKQSRVQGVELRCT